MLGYLDSVQRNDLMLFSAYFDGSGKLHDKTCSHVVLGGVVFYENAVADFCKAWAECLARHSKKAKRPILPFLHASKALALREEFENWKDIWVDELLLELAKLTRDAAYSLISAPANGPAYKLLDPSFQKKLEGVNELSFEVCINELVAQSGPSDHLHIVCDDEENEAMQMYSFLHRYKNRYPTRRGKFVAVCFADDKVHPPLQAADLFAYVTRQEYDRRNSAKGYARTTCLYNEYTCNGSTTVDYAWTRDGDGLGSATAMTA